MASVFTEILQALAVHSEKLDHTPTHKDFFAFQQLEARIIKAYNEGRFNDSEYRAFYAIARAIRADYRLALRLNCKG